MNIMVKVQFRGAELFKKNGGTISRRIVPTWPGGGGVLGLKTDGGVPLAAENWTQKDRGKNWIWGQKDRFL